MNDVEKMRLHTRYIAYHDASNSHTDTAKGTGIDAETLRTFKSKGFLNPEDCVALRDYLDGIKWPQPDIDVVTQEQRQQHDSLAAQISAELRRLADFLDNPAVFPAFKHARIRALMHTLVDLESDIDSYFKKLQEKAAKEGIDE